MKLLRSCVPPVVGLSLALGLWALVSRFVATSLPGPLATWSASKDLPTPIGPVIETTRVAAPSSASASAVHAATSSSSRPINRRAARGAIIPP